MGILPRHARREFRRCVAREGHDTIWNSGQAIPPLRPCVGTWRLRGVRQSSGSRRLAVVRIPDRAAGPNGRALQLQTLYDRFAALRCPPAGSSSQTMRPQTKLAQSKMFSTRPLIIHGPSTRGAASSPPTIQPPPKTSHKRSPDPHPRHPAQEQAHQHALVARAQSLDFLAEHLSDLAASALCQPRTANGVR